jgi:hypothetical protein
MLKIIRAPNRLSAIGVTVFLAGSIEMGKAEDWQTKVEKQFEDVDYDVTIFNPRRKDWDSSWEQTIDNRKFREQVEWELTALEKSDIIFLYLSPGTKSPISLLELGLFKDKEMIVCCPDGFWRKGNVDIVCKRYGIDNRESFDLAFHRLELTARFFGKHT